MIDRVDSRDPLVWILAVLATVVAVLAFSTRSGDTTGSSFVQGAGEPTAPLPTPQVLPTPVPTPAAPVSAASVTVAYTAEAITIGGSVPSQALLDGLLAAAGRLVPADSVTVDAVVDETASPEGGTVVLSGVVADDTVRAAVVSAFADLGLGVEDRLVRAGADQTVTDVLAETPRVAEFAEFVDLSGLGNELAGPGEGGFTVFAPTNNAVLGVDDIVLGDLGDIASLDQLLRTHVVAGALTEADLVPGTSLQSLQGEVLAVTAADDGTILVGGAALTGDAITASNGVVFTINQVLLPGTLRTEVRLNEIVGRRPVQFASGSAEIQQESLDILDRVAQVLIDNPAGDVEIQGHTDSDGAARVNRRLSQDRADAVLAYLVSQGVAAERLIARGFGETVPLVDPEVTASDQATNRRIEFRVRPG